MNKNIFATLLIYPLFVAFIMVGGHTALAQVLPAVSLVSRTPDDVGVGSRVVIDLRLDHAQYQLNAIEGSFYYPGGDTGFEVESVLVGGSAVSHWVERPRAHKDEGVMRFAGVAPGGFPGDGPSHILTIVTRAHQPGEFNVRVGDVRVYDNDGLGTDYAIDSASITIVANPAVESILTPPIEDIDPPDPFLVRVIQDRRFGLSHRTLIFNAIDRGSGVSHYVLRTTAGRSYEIASPFEISDDLLLSDIQVVAVDYFGNTTYGTLVFPSRSFSLGQSAGVLFLILFIICGLYWLYRYNASLIQKQ